MTSVEVALIAGVGIPILGFLIVVSVQWGGLRADIKNIGKELSQIVDDKEQTHKELIDQMREDRKATDRRLSWLEQNLWKKMS